MVDYLRLHFVPYGPHLLVGAADRFSGRAAHRHDSPCAVESLQSRCLGRASGSSTTKSKRARFRTAFSFRSPPCSSFWQFLGKTNSTSREDDGDLSTSGDRADLRLGSRAGFRHAACRQDVRTSAVDPLQLEGGDPETPKKATDKHLTVTLLFVPSFDGGPGLLVSFRVRRERSTFRSAKIGASKYSGGDRRGGLVLPSRTSFPESSVGRSRTAEHQVRLRRRQRREQPLYRLGKEDGSHVQFGKAEVELELSPAVAGVKALLRESELVLNLDKSGNGFLSKILPGEKKIPLNFGLGWSTERGLFLEGGKGNVLKQTNPPPPPPPSSPRLVARSRTLRSRDVDTGNDNDADLNRITPVGKTFGPVRIQFLSIESQARVRQTAKPNWLWPRPLAVDVQFGPVTASIDKMGFTLTADFVKSDANLSLFDLDFGFQPPKAIGLDIDAKVVHGGGFLDLDRGTRSMPVRSI